MKITEIIKSDLLKNTSTLISGTMLAQLIPILLQPYLRRQYSPEIFGIYAVYLSLIGILITVSSFRYDLAIVLPKKNKIAINVLSLSQIINFGVNLCFLIIILLFKNYILDFLNISEHFFLFLVFVPAGTLLYNLYTAINYYLLRHKAYVSISINKIFRRTSEGAFQSGLTFYNFTPGLLFGDIIGHITNVISGVIQIRKNGFRIKQISVAKLRYVSKKYREYPRFNLVPALMSACSYLLPALIINKFYSSEMAGYFDLSKQLLSIPLALIASSVSNVLLQQISEKYRNNQSIIKEIKQVLYIVLAIGFIEVIVVQIWSKPIFRIAFGQNWDISAEISQTMVWSFAIHFITASFSGIFLAIKKIKILSIWQVIYFIAISGLFVFKTYPFKSFIKIFVFIEVCCNILYIIILIKTIVAYEKSVKKN